MSSNHALSARIRALAPSGVGLLEEAVSTGALSQLRIAHIRLRAIARRFECDGRVWPALVRLNEDAELGSTMV
jgi:hypothetical protein